MSRVRTTDPSTEVLQLDRKSTSRLSCFTIPPTAMELTSRIAESLTFLSLARFSTSDVSEEVIIFSTLNNTPITHTSRKYHTAQILRVINDGQCTEGKRT